MGRSVDASAREVSSAATDMASGPSERTPAVPGLVTAREAAQIELRLAEIAECRYWVGRAREIKRELEFQHGQAKQAAMAWPSAFLLSLLQEADRMEWRGIRSLKSMGEEP